MTPCRLAVGIYLHGPQLSVGAIPAPREDGGFRPLERMEENEVQAHCEEAATQLRVVLQKIILQKIKEITEARDGIERFCSQRV